MPYIDENIRQELDNSIMQMILTLKTTVKNREDNVFDLERLTAEQLMGILGNINYTFSRIIANIMGDISYSKIAMLTGVLENIKQEFYRRAASSYENSKINENGDIREYKLLQ